VLTRVGLQSEADAIRGLASTLSGSPLSTRMDVEPLEDRLPPRESIVIDFVGRTKEQDVLWAWFSDPVSKRWALACTLDSRLSCLYPVTLTKQCVIGVTRKRNYSANSTLRDDLRNANQRDSIPFPCLKMRTNAFVHSDLKN
jgi:hypothetical protein